MAADEMGALAAALPGYEITGELGRGAFGVVLAGRHRQLGRRVAIKQLPRAFSDIPEVRRRFSAEAKILASLDHPHIVPIFDYVEHDGLCVLVMEMLPGGTVRQRQAHGMSMQAACAVALGACSALDYAHTRGVLHRDVKPDNLLFTSVGLLKVTDFGIAKVVGDVAVTQIGETPGTPLYMAPEQCLGQPLGPATDVYSTGLMLYELLAGEHPFAGPGTVSRPDAVAIMYRQVHEEAPPLQARQPAVPHAIADVVMGALAKGPSDRYQSARLFGAALADAAAKAWGEAWPSGEAQRVMSVGPIEAATGWSLTTGTFAVASSDDARSDARVDSPPAGQPAGFPTDRPPLYPTVIRPLAGDDGAAGARRPDGASDVPPPAPPWTPIASAPPRPAPTQALPRQPVEVNAPPVPWDELAGGYPPSVPPTVPPTGRRTLRVPMPPVPPPSAHRRGPMIALVAALIAILLVAGLLAATRNRGSRRTAAPTTVPPATTNAAQVARDVNQLVQRSAAARNQVVGAVGSIENCSADLAGAASALTAAVTTRQQVVTALAALKVDALASGAAMRLAMTSALNDSIDADRHFQAWLSMIVASGGCRGQAPHDVNWQDAQASSSAATSAKETFAALWNPVATTYHFPAVSSSTI